MVDFRRFPRRRPTRDVNARSRLGALREEGLGDAREVLRERHAAGSPILALSRHASSRSTESEEEAASPGSASSRAAVRAARGRRAVPRIGWLPVERGGEAYWFDTLSKRDRFDGGHERGHAPSSSTARFRRAVHQEKSGDCRKTVLERCLSRAMIPCLGRRGRHVVSRAGASASCATSAIRIESAARCIGRRCGQLVFSESHATGDVVVAASAAPRAWPST